MRCCSFTPLQLEQVAGICRTRQAFQPRSQTLAPDAEEEERKGRGRMVGVVEGIAHAGDSGWRLRVNWVDTRNRFSRLV